MYGQHYFFLRKNFFNQIWFFTFYYSYAIFLLLLKNNSWTLFFLFVFIQLKSYFKTFPHHQETCRLLLRHHWSQFEKRIFLPTEDLFQKLYNIKWNLNGLVKQIKLITYELYMKIWQSISICKLIWVIYFKNPNEPPSGWHILQTEKPVSSKLTLQRHKWNLLSEPLCKLRLLFCSSLIQDA